MKIILFLIFTIIITQQCSQEEDSCGVIKSIRFEVFGKVQGVYFRKYTQQKASELGLVGWVQNTHKGTVIGVAQGMRIEELKYWLQHIGSPKSKIKKLEIIEEQLIEQVDYDDFIIIR